MANAVDEGDASLTENGRSILKTFSSGSLKYNSHPGRGIAKAGFWGSISKSTLPRLCWSPIVGWAFIALFFTFVLHVGFRRRPCLLCAFIANTSGEGDGATLQTSSPSISLKFAQDLAKAVDGCHNCKQEKQEEVGDDDLHSTKQEKEETHLEKQQIVPDGNNEERDVSYCEHPSALTMVHLFKCAVHIGRENKLKTKALGAKAPPGRVAFLFLTRSELSLEPLWRRFFEGHEELYSIYVHTQAQFSFKNDSFFYEHQVPRKLAERFQITLVDAVRRLLAHAILDPVFGATNSWFVLACESTIPIHSFNFTYDYLMESQHSFVDSFKPKNQTLAWFDAANETPFAREKARKGEMWWAIQLRHALMVLEDWDIYYKYKRLCTWYCAPDEQYIQTLLGMKDPQGIENRTVYYINWEEHNLSPHVYESTNLTVEWFRDIQSRTVDQDGQYQDTSYDAQWSETKIMRHCYYNGVANSTCFLFARKISAFAREHLESLPTSVLEY
ncbi:unnamed protein product [Calypogeia fissa]